MKNKQNTKEQAPETNAPEATGEEKRNNPITLSLTESEVRFLDERAKAKNMTKTQVLYHMSLSPVTNKEYPARGRHTKLPEWDASKGSKTVSVRATKGMQDAFAKVAADLGTSIQSFLKRIILEDLGIITANFTAGRDEEGRLEYGTVIMDTTDSSSIGLVTPLDIHQQLVEKASKVGHSPSSYTKFIALETLKKHIK